MGAGSSHSGSGSEDEAEAAQRDFQAGLASQASLGARAPSGAKAQDAVWNGSAWVDPSSDTDGEPSWSAETLVLARLWDKIE